jgi:hypothetical protein
MERIQYIILQQEEEEEEEKEEEEGREEEEEETFTVAIFYSDSYINIVKPEDRHNTNKIRKLIFSFPNECSPSVMRVHVNNTNISEDKLFSFVKTNLPSNVKIKRSETTNNQVYEINNNKVIMLVHKSQWEKIIERKNEIHTADHHNGEILESIYSLSKTLPLSYVSGLKANIFLPKKCLQKYIRLHTVPNDVSRPTIQWSNEHRWIYRINDYPKSVLLKICPQISSKLASLWKHNVVSLSAVLYFITDRYVCEIVPDEDSNEFAATLNWQEGTFITNIKYNDYSDITLISEITEPHLVSCWGLPTHCSVVGNSGKVYYGLTNIKDFDENVLSEKGALFINRILTSSTWYKDNYKLQSKKTLMKEKCEFIKSLYQELFHQPIFCISERDESGNIFDNRSILEKLCDFACIKKHRLYFHIAIKNKRDNSTYITCEPISFYFEHYLSVPNEGQEAIINGFIYHITNVLFTQYRAVRLRN